MSDPVGQPTGTWEKIQLYVVSLWLLFILVIVVTADIPVCIGDDCHFVGFQYLIKTNIVPLVSLLFLCLGMLFAAMFNYKLRGGQRLPTTINSVENINFEHLTFLITYIVPLVGMDLTKTKYVAVVVLLLAFIGAIYVKTGIFYANPSLALLGYHIYKAKGEFSGVDGEGVVIISRQKLNSGDMVHYKRLDDKIVFARRAE